MSSPLKIRMPRRTQPFHPSANGVKVAAATKCVSADGLEVCRTDSTQPQLYRLTKTYTPRGKE